MSFASSLDDIRSHSVVRHTTLLQFGAHRQLALFIRPNTAADASAMFVYVCTQEWYTVVSRIVTFPDGFFPEKTIPGWSLSRKDVSQVVIFPDETFPRKSS